MSKDSITCKCGRAYQVELGDDEWHPASDPPKPEDFKPTGWILWGENKLFHPPIFIPFLCHKSNGLPELATHWRKITPP